MATRVNDQQAAEKKAHIGKLNTRIERWEVLRDGKKTKFWEMLREACEAGKKSNERAALLLLRSGKDDELGLARGKACKAEAFEEILSDVDDAEKKIKKANQDISLLRQSLKRAKDNHGIID